jgi:hypothetical protein
MAVAFQTVGRNSVADVKIGASGALIAAAVSYKFQFQFFSVRSIVPQIDASTFGDEPNTKYEPGESVYIATMNGLLKQGLTGANVALNIAGMWFPAPQKVPMTLQYAANCTVGVIGDDGTGAAGWFNFEDNLATRGVNTNSVIAGTARSCGVVTTSWVIA